MRGTHDDFRAAKSKLMGMPIAASWAESGRRGTGRRNVRGDMTGGGGVSMITFDVNG